MENIVLTIAFLLTFTISLSSQTAQDTTINPVNEDFLKQQLFGLSIKVSKIQQNLHEAKTIQDKKDLIPEIDKRQIEAVRLSGSFVERFAQGAIASTTILSALETGATIGELSSPFVSPTFTKNYDNWIGKWGKYIPSIVLPTIALSISKLNSDQKLLSVPIGISITGLISGLNKSDNKKNVAIEESIKNFQSTMELFDLNRLVYSDIQKLKSYIHSANNADSLLSKEFIKFWSENKDLFLKSDEEVKVDSRYKSYINLSQLYMSRFQFKLTKIKFVLDQVESMITSYNGRDLIRNYPSEGAPRIQTETKLAMEKLQNTYNNFKANWEELQGKFYQITPDELRKLDSYYQLENLKIQATPNPTK